MTDTSTASSPTSSKKAHLTAISRRTVSKPMQAIATVVPIFFKRGTTLDYGCGRGYDADEFCMAKYDPHYFPVMPIGSFEMITCNYVLNVIESVVEKARVIRDIQAMLTDTGCAYITVRNDHRSLNGITSRGTWQDLTILSGCSVFKTCAGYTTYVVLKGDTDIKVRASIG